MGTDAHINSHKHSVATLSNLLTGMQTMLQDMIFKTSAIIDSSNASLQDKISAMSMALQRFQDQSRCKINELADCVDKIKADVCSIHDRVIANERSNDLLLFGVPYYPAEDLRGHLRLICAQLGFSEKNLPLIHVKRLSKTTIKAGSKAPIMIRFAFKNQRRDFFRRYLSTLDLSLHHLGFQNKERIYLDENLTKLGRLIKGAALKMKRDGKLYSVYTNDGIVHIRTTADINELNLPKTCATEFPDPDDLLNFKLVICPDEGFYKGGRFVFNFKVGPNYPHEPPKVKCETQVYHPNIDLEGNVCLNILREDWKPVLTINSIVYGLQYLFLEPNPEDPLNREAAEVLQTNRRLFEHNVFKAMRGSYIGETYFERCLK